MSRFIKLPTYFYLEDELYFGDLYINPFQIESFQEAKIEYIDENGIEISRDGVNVTTKSGIEHGLLVPLQEFLEVIL